jgi:hypothetical protein
MSNGKSAAQYVSWLKRKARQRRNLTAYTILFPPKIKKTTAQCLLKFFAILHIVAIEEKDIHTQLRAS